MFVDGCEEMMYNGITWPETDLGDRASAECPCSDIIGLLAGRAKRLCGGDYSNGAYWINEVDTSGCAAVKSSITGELCRAAASVSKTKCVNALSMPLHILWTMVCIIERRGL